MTEARIIELVALLEGACALLDKGDTNNAGGIVYVALDRLKDLQTEVWAEVRDK